jgi:uncharacterized protein (DUF488 family)
VDLGGYRAEGYEAYMATPAWRSAFAALLDLAQGARVAACCAEARPEGCHRRFIADRAAAEGWTVRHILDARQATARPGVHQTTLDETEG